VHQVSVVELDGCRLSAAAAPALARLLGGCAVTRLDVSGDFEHDQMWADEAGTVLLCDAVRESTSLQELTMTTLDAWGVPAAGAALLGALTGHMSVRHLTFSFHPAVNAQSTAAAAAALGALVAADTLTYLDVSFSSLGDAALGPLFDALPAVTRLRTLLCVDQSYGRDDLSDAFVRNRVLPAVRANSSLRALSLSHSEWPSLREVEALVNSRADA
jgi:hypothetical protein